MVYKYLLSDIISTQTMRLHKPNGLVAHICGNKFHRKVNDFFINIDL